MSGKAYTMKEMKDIVEYLTEHKAYSDIKGRKMWMDLASSDATSRTWQSLKETFLKRILPDIHNPYYKLSVHQLASFKQGCDIEAKLNNKLEIRSTDAVSNTEDVNNKVIDQVEKEIENNEDEPSGENCKQIDSHARDSTDTLVLENSCQPTEDIKKDLQSANEDDDKEEAQPKSLRDLITYSEPLSVLQHTIDDFATDEEGSNGEPQMQIVEPEESAKKDSNASNGNNCVVEIPDSDSGEKEITNQSSAKQVTDKAALSKPNNDKSVNVIVDVVDVEGKKKNESTALFEENHVGNKTNEAETISKINNKSDNQRKSSDITQNTNTITDSLPNNQEAFQNKTKQSSKKDQVSVTNEEKKQNRKRANSQESSQPKNIKKSSLSLKKPSISDSDTILTNITKKKLNSKNIEKQLNKIDEVNKPVIKEKLTNVGKITEAPPVNISDTVNQDVEMTTSDIENPCLKSVSLYEEEVSYNKKFESQKEKNENSKEKPTNSKKNDSNEVVILKSHSDSVSDNSKMQSPPKKGKQEVTKQRRDRAMADVFGFSRGRVNKKTQRKRNVSYKHSTSHQAQHISSGSSEWTSDTDSEFISPPRGRKNRQTRKYLKPKHARILSLEEEGGLFVMYGKKIFPIVKDGKIIKNYVTYTPEEEVDQEESFWKLKYVEEKKRTDELTKLLSAVQEKGDNGNQGSALALTENPISNIKQKEVIKIKQDVPDNKSTEALQSKTDTEDKTVKFKFTKNNEELQLEGHWSHVNPVLAQVMQLFQKNEGKDINDQTNKASTRENKKKTKTSYEQKNAKQNEPNVNGTKSNDQVLVSQDSGQSTPIIPIDIEEDVKERVSKIESEIFKEIEENAREESTKKKTSQPEENITKRRGRPRKSSASTSSISTSATPSKKVKLDTEPNKEKEITEENKTTNSESRITRSPKQSVNESPKKARTRISLSRKSKEVGSPNLNKKEEVRYKFPSPEKTKKSKIAKATKAKANRYLTSLDDKAHSPPESRSLCSIDSTQDFQDSDESVLNVRKRKRTAPYKRKSPNRYRSNSHPFLTDDITSESSNSYQSSPLKSMTFQNSTISCDNYSSESYRLLMNKNLTQKHKPFQNLEKIVESPNLNELKSISEQIYEDIMANDVDMQTDSKIKDSAFKMATDDSVSNVSLPTSPVLSIVQNMSVSKDLLSSVDDFPIEKLPYGNQIILNSFIKSEADVSMPLMARDCGIETNGQKGEEYHYNLSAVKDTPISDTFLSKVNTFNIKDPTITDSINTKLKDLMLESTKKTIKGVCGSDENNNMEYEENIKTKSRKRSSTPLKRKSSRRLTLSNNEPCIEEHTESCSYSRKSCPPVVQHLENIDINSNVNVINSKPKTRQKKDLNKVKITKPKSGKERKADNISERSISNVIIDASINESESGVFLHCLNDSVDLIHNHSETCLNAQDCMEDSIQLLEESKSVIFLDSTGNSEPLLQKYEDNVNSIEYELFSNDAQDASELGKVKSASASTVYHPLMGSLFQENSLMTEDLSDGPPVKNIVNDGSKIPRNTKWYLLSEDETTNTNFLDINQNSAMGLGCGANLNELFPITCAVPELSTITEVSNQKEENLK